jgi:hypothetical protein
MRSWQLPDSPRTYMVFGPFGFVMYLKASPNELDEARIECSFYVDHSTHVVDLL